LTPEQKEIAVQPFTNRQVVLAGPGTGKTHVVAARLVDLVLVQGLKPHSQLLLLSYTRTAVREMHERLDRAAQQLRARTLSRVDIRTMDSFAFGLHDAAGVTHPGGGYDEGMRSAVELLRDNEDARAAVSEFRHIIVDEAQDLFAVRNQFIRSVLQHAGGGFTVLADPNQAIYDYLLLEEGRHEEDGVDSLLRWLTTERQANVAELRGSKRHQGVVKDLVERAEAHLRNPKLDWLAKWHSIVKVLQSAGTLRKAELESTLQGLSGSTAILTRTNGEALLVSEYLLDLDHPVPHLLLGPPSSSTVPGWIGRILPSLPARFSIDDVNIVWDAEVARPFGRVTDGDVAFRHLTLMAGEPDVHTVERKAVETRIAQPYRLPAEALYEPVTPGSIVVSTVHRAKGREFDNVILVEPSADATQEPGQLPMEVRVLYVAVSRPRTRMSLVHFGGGCRLIDTETGQDKRWFVPVWNRNMPAKIELRPDDVDPFSTVPEGSAEDVQERVWSMAGVEGLIARTDPYVRGRWNLWMRTGRRSKEFVARFGQGFDRIMQAASRAGWGHPGDARSLSNVWVEGVATYVLPPDEGSHLRVDSAYAKRGYWLVPVVRGLAAVWSRGEPQSDE
jgi:hypothetical protein